MALEEGLYAQVVMFRRRELNDKREKTRKKIYYFQGQSVRKKHWFDLDHECLKEKFMTHELYFYRKNIKLN